MDLAYPGEDPLVVLEDACAESTREHQDVRVGHLFEGGVADDPQHPVFAADLTPVVTDEHDVEARDALEDLVGPDGIEGGERVEERDGDGRPCGHGVLPVVGAVANRRR